MERAQRIPRGTRLPYDRLAFVLGQRGWCPAKWAHHPPEIRSAIRRAGFVPQLQQCFRNCQRVVMFGGLDDATYHEGIAIPALCEHAWITWRGLLTDLTWPEPAAVLRGYPVSTRDLRKVFLARDYWGAIYPDRLRALEDKTVREAHAASTAANAANDWTGSVLICL